MSTIQMDKKELLDEHKHLVRVLADGSLAERKKEAKKQKGELREYVIEKGQGEGSRGGHVIGHTRTGKPIYEHGSHETHLTPDEHHDAAQAHEAQADWHRTGASMASGDDSLPDEMRETLAKEHEQKAVYHIQRALRQQSREAKKSFVIMVNPDLDKPLDGEVASIAVMSGTKLLMGARTDCGRWTLPGGHIEPGEDPLAGAIRELQEETGIYAHDLNYLGSEEVTTFTGKRYLIHSFMMTSEPETTTAHDPDHEVVGWTWIDVSNGLPDHVEANLHSPKNLTLRLLGLQKSLCFITDLVKGTAGQMMPGHKYIRRYKGHTGEWVYVYHEVHPHHMMSAAELGKFKRLAELGNVEAKSIVDSIQDYHPEHLSLLRQLADIGNVEANSHLGRMGIDRAGEKIREEMERTERKARDVAARSNPFTADLSAVDHTKAVEAVKSGVNTSVFGHLRSHATTDPARALEREGVTLDKIMEGVEGEKSIKGILEKLHENLKLIDRAHRGVTSANSAANTAGGYGNLGYNSAIEALKDQNLIPQSHGHRRSQDGHTVPVDEWKRLWDREAAERQRRVEETRVRAAREAKAERRRAAGVVAYHGTMAHHIMKLTGKTDGQMNTSEIDALHKSLTHVFGHEPKVEEWPYDFSDKGLTVKVRSVTPHDHGVEFKLEILKDGVVVTRGWDREWSRVGSHVKIYNAYLATNSSFRGTGVDVGALVNGNQIKMLKAIDPTGGTISTYANCDVGGYNWANQPFSFESPAERESWVNRFVDFIYTNSGVRLTAEEKALFKYPCHISAFDDGKTYVKTLGDAIGLTSKQKETNSLTGVAGEHPLTAAELRNGKTNRMPCHLGKYFLLGNSWHGKMKLSDMKESHEPYKFFKNYAQLKRKAYTVLKPEYVAVVERTKADVARRVRR